jgi:Flp pilus assembly protein TadG
MADRNSRMSRRPWWRDRRGVAAVEFALIAPMLLILYLGGFEAEECTTVYRKVSLTTYELANISSQYTAMSSTDLSNVFNASSEIMTPYSSSGLSILLTEVVTDASAHATVYKSEAFQGATPLAAGSPVTLPSGMAQKNTYYIMVQTSYPYTSTVGAGFFPNVTLSDQVVILPRQSASITLP